jgi:hypothetical protein
MPVIGSWLPATDGSETATFTTGGTATVASTGTALEYQLMRLGLCFTLVNGNAYYGTGNDGYNWAVTRWYDEFGDDSLTQVNVPRGYLGTPVNGTLTIITLSNGVQLRAFTGGVAIINAWGNGAQTVTSSQLSAQGLTGLFFLGGTQQPLVNTGAAFSSRAMADADGLILVY